MNTLLKPAVLHGGRAFSDFHIASSPDRREKSIFFCGFMHAIIYFIAPKTHSTGAKEGEYWGNQYIGMSWKTAIFNVFFDTCTDTLSHMTFILYGSILSALVQYSCKTNKHMFLLKMVPLPPPGEGGCFFFQNFFSYFWKWSPPLPPLKYKKNICKIKSHLNMIFK